MTIDGRITFHGEAPPKPGSIAFASVDAAEGYPTRPGDAEFDAEGKFTVTTLAEGDGLFPGKYQANVSCWREPPTLETVKSANLVPDSYCPEIEIPADVDHFELTLDVPAK